MDVKKATLTQRETYEQPPHYPPAYTEIDTLADPDSDVSSIITAPTSGGITHPIVIPQITKKIRGAFFSPFIRGYSPELEAHGISKSQFLTILDGLNECFVAHPVFQGLGVAGAVMGFFYGVQPVQWAGLGLQVAAGAASTATSYARTRAYIKAINRDLLHPAALSMTILTTKKMMAKVGYPEDKLKLPPLDLSKIESSTAETKEELTAPTLISSDDPRMRRLKALDGYITPLSLDVPTALPPDTNNFLKKMSANQAARMKRKQEGKLEKRRSKSERLHAKRTRKAERTQARGDQKTQAMAAELERNQARLEKLRVSDDGGSRDAVKMERQVEKKNAKLEQKLAKTEAKVERRLEKRSSRVEKGAGKMDRRETKIANKVRWIVVTRYDGEEGKDEDEEGEESTSDSE